MYTEPLFTVTICPKDLVMATFCTSLALAISFLVGDLMHRRFSGRDHQKIVDYMAALLVSHSQKAGDRYQFANMVERYLIEQLEDIEGPDESYYIGTIGDWKWLLEQSPDELPFLGCLIDLFEYDDNQKPSSLTAAQEKLWEQVEQLIS